MPSSSSPSESKAPEDVEWGAELLPAIRIRVSGRGLGSFRSGHPPESLGVAATKRRQKLFGVGFRFIKARMTSMTSFNRKWEVGGPGQRTARTWRKMHGCDDFPFGFVVAKRIVTFRPQQCQRETTYQHPGVAKFYS